MNVIEEMRQRLTERFSGNMKPIQGFRVTADNTPRLPQSRIPSPKVKYEKAGRPPKSNLPEKKNIWGGWI